MNFFSKVWDGVRNQSHPFFSVLNKSTHYINKEIVGKTYFITRMFELGGFILLTT